ncbi:MAG: WYL domain-containing protein [Nocardioidaceae bacterium]|nr:WYL domain-containing protein [Nocardioidaceae bacterium]
MSSAPKYVERIARLPRVFELLIRHPEGMALASLADDLDLPVAELREDLLAFYTADLGSWWVLSRPNVLEFIGADGFSENPGTAEIVRMVAEGPTDLGVEYVDAGELGLVYTAALALLETDPENPDLGEAIDVLAETMFGTVEEKGLPAATREWNRLLPTLRTAMTERRAVRIIYSRAWKPGVAEREIEPYRLVQTRRGWEVDAGPIDEAGRLRTYLLSNIREAQPLDRAFEVPADVEERFLEQRATTRVKVVLPQTARWAADFYAERVTLVADDEESVEVDLDLLPPVEGRVGRLLLTAGPDAFVVSPRELENAGAVLAEELLIHHTT